MSNISIGFCTRNHNPSYNKHLLETCGNPRQVEIIEIVNDGSRSLAECYNEIYNKATSDIVVFLHDDLIIGSDRWGKKLIKLFEKNSDFGIIGIAGTTHMRSGMWWEIREAMQGQVRHQHNGKEWRNNYSGRFGEGLKEVVVVDGLFFAVSKERVKKPFDEEFPGFHFYDIPFCVSNYKEGVKIGVTTMIEVTHKSIGAVDKKWEKNKLFFEAKYGELLPLQVT